MKRTVSPARPSSELDFMEQVAAGFVHDFNNMLQGVVGSLDLMQTRIGQGRTEEIPELLQIALGSLRRTAALTDSLLALWRPQLAELKIVNVNRIIQSMEGLFRCTLGDKIEVQLVLTNGLSAIACDPRQLENVLLNMVVNARNAMPRGGRVVVRTFCDQDTDETGLVRQRSIVICVTDTGVGMVPDFAEHVFDPNYVINREGRGIGLGLAMIKCFVDQLAGRVKLKSVVGEGTTIALYLPTR
jgi:signal transduction histidine kinase